MTTEPSPPHPPPPLGPGAFVHRLRDAGELTRAMDLGVEHFGVHEARGTDDPRYAPDDDRCLGPSEVEDLLHRFPNRLHVELAPHHLTPSHLEHLTQAGARGILIDVGTPLPPVLRTTLQRLGLSVVRQGLEADLDTDPSWLHLDPQSDQGLAEVQFVVIELLPETPHLVGSWLRGEASVPGDLLEVGDLPHVFAARPTWVSLPRELVGQSEPLTALGRAGARGVFVRLGKGGPGSEGTRHLYGELDEQPPHEVHPRLQQPP